MWYSMHYVLLITGGSDVEASREIRTAEERSELSQRPTTRDKLY